MRDFSLEDTRILLESRKSDSNSITGYNPITRSFRLEDLYDVVLVGP